MLGARPAGAPLRFCNPSSSWLCRTSHLSRLRPKRPLGRRLHSIAGQRIGRFWRYLSLGANIRERFEINDPQFGIGGSRRYEDVLSRLEAHSDLRVAGQAQILLQVQSDVASPSLPFRIYAVPLSKAQTQ